MVVCGIRLFTCPACGRKLAWASPSDGGQLAGGSVWDRSDRLIPAQARDQQPDQPAGVVARIVARADAQIAHAAHQLVGLDVADDLAGIGGRIEQLRAYRNQAVEEVGVQRLEGGVVGL